MPEREQVCHLKSKQINKKAIILLKSVKENAMIAAKEVLLKEIDMY